MDRQGGCERNRPTRSSLGNATLARERRGCDHASGICMYAFPGVCGVESIAHLSLGSGRELQNNQDTKRMILTQTYVNIPVLVEPGQALEWSFDVFGRNIANLLGFEDTDKPPVTVAVVHEK